MVIEVVAAVVVVVHAVVHVVGKLFKMAEGQVNISVLALHSR